MGLDRFLTLWHLKALIIWILVNCSIPWYVIWRNKRLRKAINVEDRFKPFVRTDINEWAYLRCIFTHFFFIPRFSTCVLALILALISTKLICIGADFNNLGPLRRKLILKSTCLWMRMFLPCFGVYKTSYVRPKVDYSKWLGPDWKANYEGTTMYVCNH